MGLPGSPILNDATRGCIMKKLSAYKRMNDRILLFEGHRGLEKAFSLTRLLSTHRTAPCHHHPELLTEYDEVTHSTTEALINVHFDDNSWSQAKLPVRFGDHELRTATEHALPAFQSTRAVGSSLVKSLLNDIFHQPTNTQENNDRIWTEISTYLPSQWKYFFCSSIVGQYSSVHFLTQHISIFILFSISTIYGL